MGMFLPIGHEFEIHGDYARYVPVPLWKGLSDFNLLTSYRWVGNVHQHNAINFLILLFVAAGIGVGVYWAARRPAKTDTSRDYMASPEGSLPDGRSTSD